MRIGWVWALALLAGQDVGEHVKAGQALLKAGNASGAEAAFTKALEIDPDHVGARVGRGLARRQREGLTAAEQLEDLDHAVRLAPRVADVWLQRAYTRQQLKNWAEAAADFTKVLELGYASPAMIRALRAECLASLDRNAEALADYDAAIEGGYRTGRVYMRRGLWRYFDLQMRGAVSDFTRAYRESPEVTHLILMRAWAYFAQGSWDNAIRDFRAHAQAMKKPPASSAAAIIVASVRAKDAKGAAVFADSLGPELQASKLVRYARGGMKEDEFLWPAEGDDFDEIRFFHAQVDLTKGHDAREVTQRALKLMRPRSLGGCVLRFQQRQAEVEARRARVEVLEEALRKRPPFKATYAFVDGLDPDTDGMTGITLWVDYPGRRAAYLLEGREKGKVVALKFLVDGFRLTMWGGEEGEGVIDGSSFFSGFEDLINQFSRDLDAASGAVEEVAKAAHQGLQVIIDLGGKPDAKTRGSIRLACGWASSPAHWLREARNPESTLDKTDEGHLRLEMDAGHKTFVIDGATGLLREVRVKTFDGKDQGGLVLKTVENVEGWPPLRPPDGLKAIPFDTSELRSRLEAQFGFINFHVVEAMERWERIPDAKKVEVVSRGVTRWAARYLDSVHSLAIRSMARKELRQALEEGVGLETLLKEVDGRARRLAAILASRPEDAVGFMRERVLDVQ
ncbi:MAG TPA: tetratricopeptide repeat protein [Planctomycetota bacterium]